MIKLFHAALLLALLTSCEINMFPSVNKYKIPQEGEGYLFGQQAALMAPILACRDARREDHQGDGYEDAIEAVDEVDYIVDETEREQDRK